ncbi:MAG: hypothetical protein RL639_228 [Verrucomicrobiota bacterium]
MDRRTRDSAKVQIGAELLCKGERGEAARGHAGTVTRGQEEEAGLKWGSKGKPDDWLGHAFSGVGSQLTGYQVRVFRCGCGYGS